MSDKNGHGHRGNQRTVGIAAALTGVFMLAEVVGGIVSGSLALLADAGHMLTDFASLGLAWFGFQMAQRPADSKRTYGFDRFSVLAAFVNGITLFAIAIWITVEAIRRFMDPGEVLGGMMLWVAVAGLVVNILAFIVLTRGEKENLNIRAAALHVMGDLLGSVAAIAAALVIIFTGWMPADPILSVLVALLILRAAWLVIRDSGHILLEGTPKEFDRQAVKDALLEIDGVVSVSHMHAWLITEERPMITLEVGVSTNSDEAKVKRTIKTRLQESFGIDHATVETSTH